jgi:hypothetical protein
MRIKDCMACRLKEEMTSEFLKCLIPGAMYLESVSDWLETQYDNAEHDDETDWTKEFLDHMSTHDEDIGNLLSKTDNVVVNLVKEVF